MYCRCCRSALHSAKDLSSAPALWDHTTPWRECSNCSTFCAVRSSQPATSSQPLSHCCRASNSCRHSRKLLVYRAFQPCLSRLSPAVKRFWLLLKPNWRDTADIQNKLQEQTLFTRVQRGVSKGGGQLGHTALKLSLLLHVCIVCINVQGCCSNGIR